MPPRKKPWFRVYVEMVWDRKIRRLSVNARWLWIAVLSIARSSPVAGYLVLDEGSNPVQVADLADVANLSARETDAALKELLAERLIDRDIDTGWLFVTRWNERQFESDTSSQRTAKYRSNNVTTSSDVTPPEDREQRTDKDPPTPQQVGGRKGLRAEGENPRAIATKQAATRRIDQILDSLNDCQTCGEASWDCERCARLRNELATLRPIAGVTA